jgi:ribonuclease J
MTKKELMEKTGFLAIIKPEEWCEKFLDPFIDDYKSGKSKMDQMPVIIYSMWEGYVQEYLKDENGNRINNKAKNQAWIDFLMQNVPE